MGAEEFFTNDGFLPALRRAYDRLSAAQRKIAGFILQSPEKAVRCSISQLAEATGTKSESGIVRFYRAFGFNGYNDMKVSLAMEFAQNTYYRPYEAITTEDSPAAIKDKIFTGAMCSLERSKNYLENAALDQAVAILAETKRLYVMGFAISYFLAEMAWFKFSKIIPVCRHFCDPHVAAAMTAMAAEGDTLLAISHSGESRDLVLLAEEISPPAQVIALTSFADSPLARVAACKLVVDPEDNYRTDAAMARLAQLAVIETLFLGLAIRLGQEALPALDRSHRAVTRLKY